MAQIAAIGEVMIELSPYPTAPEETREIKALSFAGDTYNTSVYLARLGLKTHYATLLGDDHYSEQILQCMHDEGIGVDLVTRTPGRNPGLYMIHNSPEGEREFFYWRREAPARELFSDPTASVKLYQQLAQFDCIYLSGITLAILKDTARENLVECLAKLRSKGVRIVFDSNYRPRLWNNIAQAQSAMRAVLEHTDIALLTLDDEYQLWGDDSVEGCQKRYANLELNELVLKRGSEDTVVIVDGQVEHVAVTPVQHVIDTTGAGDTFNAGYLAARLQGESAAESARQGNRCAGIVIQHRGGVLPKTVFETELNKG
ncbi:sugar kinase [Marinimicrobium sp. ABcell2]|uniref:sugar kinase n=1 Tax=Marinimicrobium sp. ABcell2 TaxID=3069751 RepID=UPI0027B5B436|nr:sugar kinase [Marinimicrobium sp. ABcell2]MDQ2076036.1 sugar kinase [Marinimicrobium sp. ABcell2]